MTIHKSPPMELQGLSYCVCGGYGRADSRMLCITLAWWRLEWHWRFPLPLLIAGPLWDVQGQWFPE